MCDKCYEKYGSPKVVNTKTVLAAWLTHLVYEYSCVGGNAHIVLDDFNIEDGNIDFCISRIITDKQSSQEQLVVEFLAMTVFRIMTLEERASALGICSSLVPCDIEFNHLRRMDFLMPSKKFEHDGKIWRITGNGNSQFFIDRTRFLDIWVNGEKTDWGFVCSSGKEFPEGLSTSAMFAIDDVFERLSEICCTIRTLSEGDLNEKRSALIDQLSLL